MQCSLKKKKKRKVSRMIRDNFTLECIRIFTTNIDKLFYVTIINSYLFTRVVRQTNGRICKMINTSLILSLSLINYPKKRFYLTNLVEYYFILECHIHNSATFRILSKILKIRVIYVPWQNTFSFLWNLINKYKVFLHKNFVDCSTRI